MFGQTKRPLFRSCPSYGRDPWHESTKIMEISKALLYQGHYGWLLSSSVLVGGMGILFSITQGLTFEHTHPSPHQGQHLHTHSGVSLSFGLLEFHQSFLHNISGVHLWSSCLHVDGGCYFRKRLNNARGRGWRRLEHGRQQHSFIPCI